MNGLALDAALRKRFALQVAAIAAAVVLASCSGGGDSSPTYPPLPLSEFAAAIRTTSYAVPHITAENFKGAGFGYGYAFA